MRQADAGGFEPFRITLPAQRWSDPVVDLRAAVAAGGIDRARHRQETVGDGRSEHRAEIAVADGEGVGERVIVRQIGAGEIAHGERPAASVKGAMSGEPTVHPAAGEARVLHGPAVIEVGKPLCAGPTRIEAEWQCHLRGRGRIRLFKDRAAAGNTCRLGIGEAAYAGKRAEIMVEGAVLFHHDDDVVDIGKPRRPLRRRRGCLTGGRRGSHPSRRSAGNRKGAARLQKKPAREFEHAGLRGCAVS